MQDGTKIILFSYALAISIIGSAIGYSWFRESRAADRRIEESDIALKQREQDRENVIKKGKTSIYISCLKVQTEDDCEIYNLYKDGYEVDVHRSSIDIENLTSIYIYCLESGRGNCEKWNPVK